MKSLTLFICIYLQTVVLECKSTVVVPTTVIPTSSKNRLNEEKNNSQSSINSNENRLNENGQSQINYGHICSINYSFERAINKDTDLIRGKDIYEKVIQSYVLEEQQMKKLDSIADKFKGMDMFILDKVSTFQNLLSEISKKYESFESKMNTIFEKKMEHILTSTNNLEKTVNNMKEDKMKNQINVNKDADKNSHGSSDSSLNCNEERNIPKDCFELHYLKGINRSGVYEIKPLLTPFKVFCDMETDGGGWTVIQNRFNGSESFHRNWQNYKLGFGNIGENSEFWLGLEKIHQVTYNQMTKLRLDFQSVNNTFGYEIYSNFQIGNELEGYILNSVGTFIGNAGDSLTYHVGSKFSTFDNDQDKYASNCAEIYTGAWWHNACHNSNLNGQYLRTPIDKSLENKGIIWKTFSGILNSLKKSKMMIRRTF